MYFTTVRSKEKDDVIYLNSEKLVHSNQKHENNVSQLFGSAKNWFLALSSLTNTAAAIWREKKVDPCYLVTKKCNSQLLRARKNIYLKSEKLFQNNKEHEKIFSHLFGSAKHWFVAISSLTNTVAAIWREKKWIPAISRPKNVVHNSQEQGKRL